jgi:hypothetical protein
MADYGFEGVLPGPSVVTITSSDAQLETHPELEKKGELRPVKLARRIDEVAMEVYKQLFSDADEVELLGQKFKVHTLGQGLALRAVEIPINGMHIRFIQQNPNTASEWARRAARGDKVMQVVINDADVQGSDKWIGNVDNGHWNPYKNSHFTSAYATEHKKAA